MVLTFRSNRSRSTIMHGVGRTSLVISRKSRRAIRVSNSAYGKGLVLAARAFAAARRPAAAGPARNCRRDVMGTSSRQRFLLGWHCSAIIERNMLRMAAGLLMFATLWGAGRETVI